MNAIVYLITSFCKTCISFVYLHQTHFGSSANVYGLPIISFKPFILSTNQIKYLLSRLIIYFSFNNFSSSSFKRQNTIDSATIKENTARLAAQNQRPSSAQPKPVVLTDTAVSSPAKPRSTTKFDPTNGNRTVGPSGMIPRRSTTIYEKTSSTEKTNAVPADSKYVFFIPSVFCFVYFIYFNLKC